MEAENELDRFRDQWRAEVARNKTQGASSSTDEAVIEPRELSRKNTASTSAPVPSTARRKDASDFSEEVEPKAYHDLPDKEESLQLGNEDQRRAAELYQEPSSALEHYERAVEKETHGQLGDSIRHYRKAFKVGHLDFSPSRHMLR